MTVIMLSLTSFSRDGFKKLLKVERAYNQARTSFETDFESYETAVLRHALKSFNFELDTNLAGFEDKETKKSLIKEDKRLTKEGKRLVRVGNRTLRLQNKLEKISERLNKELEEEIENLLKDLEQKNKNNGSYISASVVFI